MSDSGRCLKSRAVRMRSGPRNRDRCKAPTLDLVIEKANPKHQTKPEKNQAALVARGKRTGVTFEDAASLSCSSGKLARPV